MSHWRICGALTGIELLVNLDQRWPSFRFTRKFWEHYLSFIMRGKELSFEFAVVKKSHSRAEI